MMTAVEGKARTDVRAPCVTGELGELFPDRGGPRLLANLVAKHSRSEPDVPQGPAVPGHPAPIGKGRPPTVTKASLPGGPSRLPQPGGEPPALKALVIVDMLYDFVHGTLENPRAKRIIGPIRGLLDHARREGWVVVFANDAHETSDPELSIWGEHAMAGTPGAQVIEELQPRIGEREFISPKRGYGAFDHSELDERLRTLGVAELVIVGQHTDICVQHTCYGALVRGYGITIPRDAVCTYGGANDEAALAYLCSVYGVRTTTVGELVAARAAAN